MSDLIQGVKKDDLFMLGDVWQKGHVWKKSASYKTMKLKIFFFGCTAAFCTECHVRFSQGIYLSRKIPQ